jgi:pimeloyl-ACP methyl ester carboxylesterase
VAAPRGPPLGEHDTPDIHAIVELLTNGIPNARLVEMDDVAHMLNMERPAQFNRLVLDFL